MSLSQPAPEVEPAVLEVDRAMQAWFPLSVPIAERQAFSEVDLRRISDALHGAGRESWSHIPRIYVTLRSINQLPLIDVFLTQGLSDVWFPFSHKTLPNSIRSQTARNDFIAAQRLVLTKSLDLEKEDGKHKHFLKQEDVPLKTIEKLGQGGFGFVDKVISTVSYKVYARKLLLRGLTFRKNKDVLREFELELAALKKLSHIHIVELVGSYTDPKHVGILTSPVAECNLKDYLAQPLSENTSSLLRTSFGCLVAAVNYLHQSEIRHKDIKPSNILIKDYRMLITDFGISRDWSDEERSTTTGPTPMTPKYCAPEVAHYQPRNWSSDIWSLGCVFLEIWTVLCGEHIFTLETYLKSNGSKSTCYHSNTDGAGSWIQMLMSKIQDPGLKPPQTWIAIMMETDQKRRYNAQRLFDTIQEHSLVSDVGLSFIGQCCTEEDDTEESVISSEYELDMDAIAPKTTTSSATSHVSSHAARLTQAAKPTPNRSPEQSSPQSSTSTPNDLDLGHLSVREQEEILEPIDKDEIDQSDVLELEADEATQKPAQATELSHTPPNPSLVPPRLSIKEATLPRQHQPSERDNAVLRSSDSSITATPPKFAASNQDVASANNTNFLSVPDMRARNSTPVRNSSSVVTSETPIALKVLSDGNQKRFKVDFLSLLHSNIFFDTLRVLLSIPSERRIFVERYSYSAAAWIVLDPEDQTIWKAMIRAAKAKLKLRLRITTISAVVTMQDRAPPSSNTIRSSGEGHRDSSEGQMVLVDIRWRDRAKKVSIPLKRFLDTRTLLTTLRGELDAPTKDKIIFERYSDSADKYIVLDPANEQTHRQTIRAARLKGKIRVRARWEF